MKSNVPRLMFAAPGSGSGKTTITCAVLQALCNCGENPASFKCGPDYIDPMFHSEVIGAKSRNLDLFFYDGNTARALLAKNAAGCGVAVLEGVMGFYDGVGGSTSQAGSYHLAKETSTPVVLVVNARGMSLSVAALVAGFARFQKDSGICGVVFNCCNAATYPMLKKAVEQETGIRCYGFLPQLPECSLESRHLGLVTAAEVGNLRQKMELLAQEARRTINLDGLLQLAKTAPPLLFEALSLPAAQKSPVKIAIARDKAFCFYYQDALDLLEELGAVLVPFSPLEDAAFPQDVDGLLLGGGYPEVYAEQLSKNTGMLQSLCAALKNGLPYIAECGGFLYLHQTLQGEDGCDYPMVGLLNAAARNAHKLQHFGYVTLCAKHGGMLCEEGKPLPAHEFHYWESTQNGEAFLATKPVSGRNWPCAFLDEKSYMGFPHFHFYSNPAMASRFLTCCAESRKKGS